MERTHQRDDDATPYMISGWRCFLGLVIMTLQSLSTSSWLLLYCARRSTIREECIRTNLFLIQRLMRSTTLHLILAIIFG